MGLLQTENLSQNKENHQQNTREPTEWDKILQIISDKRLISKIYKEIMQLNSNNKTKTIQLKMGRESE